MAAEELRRWLYLLRHAKAEPASESGEDGDRALTERGRSDCALIAEWLSAKPLQLVLSSSARRARETAEVIAERCGCPLQVRDKLYTADADELVSLLATVDPEIAALLVCGHNPTVEETIFLLTGEHVEVPTAGLAVLRGRGSWDTFAQEGVELVEFVEPRGLASLM